MSPSSSMPIDRDAGRVSQGLADFVSGVAIEDPIDPSSSDGVEPPVTGWFNAGRVMVAVPLFNARADAERVLDAIVVFARSVPAWEFVFIDDGSDDGTVSAFQKRLAAVGFIDPGTASRLSVIPSAPHAGLGHVARIAGLECDAEHLILVLPSFRGDWSLVARVLAALQAAHVVTAAPNTRPNAALHACLRAARWLVSHALGLKPEPFPQAIGLQGHVAKALAERTRLRGTGFDLESRHLIQSLGLRALHVTPDAEATGHAIASNRGSHWIGQVGSILLAPIAIAMHRLLGRYRLRPQDSHPRARERRPHSSHAPRRKAS
jgi:hypothetical protein